MLAYGQGTPPDSAEAAKWYRKAADQGYRQAQDRLGYLYAMGEGVPEDLVLAYMWTRLAELASPSKAESKTRKSISAQMTPEQVARAEKLVRAWKPRKASVAASEKQ